MPIKQESAHFMYRTGVCVCVLPVNEWENRHQQVNRGIPLQRLDLLSQGNLEERLTNDPWRDTECSH